MLTSYLILLGFLLVADAQKVLKLWFKLILNLTLKNKIIKFFKFHNICEKCKFC